MSSPKDAPAPAPPGSKPKHPLRFHAPHAHLESTFGPRFGSAAELFARFFGTPQYLVGQTLVVIAWVIFNWLSPGKFNPFPFILLNLVFSTQAAYAAPLILLAQTRQAERDKVLTEADALHREDLAQANAERQELAMRTTNELKALMEANTELTRATEELSKKIAALTDQIHRRLIQDGENEQETKGQP